MDGLDRLTGESSTTQTNEVYTSIAHGFLTSNHVGRNVLTGARSALEHDITAHMAELVEQTGCRDNGKIVDHHLASKLCRVADDAAIADHAVVSHVHILHQQVVASYDGLTLRGRATTDGNILADGVVVANLTSRLFALEL